LPHSARPTVKKRDRSVAKSRFEQRTVGTVSPLELHLHSLRKPIVSGGRLMSNENNPKSSRVALNGIADATNLPRTHQVGFSQEIFLEREAECERTVD
jgi:hypothetical protein